MSPSDIGFPVYAMHINMLDALKGFSFSQYKHVDMSRIYKRETLSVCHSTPNAKLYQIITVKMRHPHRYILMLTAW